MFINVGGRTDITNYYSEWLINRIREGYVFSRNPLFQDKVSKYKLDPGVVDCIIFCTKNPKPIMDKLDEIKARGFKMFFYVTITSYGKDMEPGVPDYNEMIEAFKELSHVVGKNNLCWRYDPVFVTPKYTIEHHLNCYDEMAEKIAPYTNFCIFSFVEMYKKLSVTFPELRSVSEEEKIVLLKGMGKIAQRHNLRIQTCGDDNDYTEYGINRSGCITVPIIEKAIGKELKARVKPTRKGCGCIPSNDIGAYNTCPNGCKYCYATKDTNLAIKNYKAHNPKSPILIGEIKTTDIVTDARQVSFKTQHDKEGLLWD
ncbi:DUF1848 domain-containing protein [Treponema primitia]|uniref:DUF1848 domain-containing protein n=1 Tax=Treponema primitia TaxID=88058 RepID=UPI00398052C0